MPLSGMPRPRPILDARLQEQDAAEGAAAGLCYSRSTVIVERGTSTPITQVP